MPSTTTLCLPGMTRSTRPVVRLLAFPASSPVITSTMSSLRIIMITLASRLHHLGGQADDSQEAALAQLTGDRTENARAARVLLGIDQNQGIAVETDVAAVVAARGLAAADNHAANHVAGFDLAAGECLLDAGDDHVAQARIAPPRAPQHL